MLKLKLLHRVDLIIIIIEVIMALIKNHQEIITIEMGAKKVWEEIMAGEIEEEIIMEIEMLWVIMKQWEIIWGRNHKIVRDKTITIIMLELLLIVMKERKREVKRVIENLEEIDLMKIMMTYKMMIPI